MRKIRILFVLSEFMFGSKLRQLEDLAKGLDRAIYSIEICGLDIEDEAKENIEKLGFPYYQLRLIPPRTFDLKELIQFIKAPFILRKKKFDIVHSLLYQSVFTESLLVRVFTRAKYVYTKTNFQWENHQFNWWLKSNLSHGIISISQATHELLVEKGFESKTKKIHLGVRARDFQPRKISLPLGIAKESVSKKKFVFGCAAQFLELKKHNILLDAFEMLCVGNPDIELRLCGSNHGDEYYKSIVRRIGESKYNERIHLLGTVEDMPLFYSTLNCFVLPSDTETFGYVYIEAMGCGLPVIACNVGGPLDIVDSGRTGYLVEVGNSDQLHKKMKLYLDDHGLAEVHGKNGRTRMQEMFTDDVMVSHHAKFYNDLLA